MSECEAYVMKDKPLQRAVAIIGERLQEVADDDIPRERVLALGLRLKSDLGWVLGHADALDEVIVAAEMVIVTAGATEARIIR